MRRRHAYLPLRGGSLVTVGTNPGIPPVPKPQFSIPTSAPTPARSQSQPETQPHPNLIPNANPNLNPNRNPNATPNPYPSLSLNPNATLFQLQPPTPTLTSLPTPISTPTPELISTPTLSSIATNPDPNLYQNPNPTQPNPNLDLYPQSKSYPQCQPQSHPQP